MGRAYSDDRDDVLKRHRHQSSQNSDSKYKSRRHKDDEKQRRERQRKRSADGNSKNQRPSKKERHSYKDNQNSRQEKSDESSAKSANRLATISSVEKNNIELLTSKTGGAYIPPAKLRLMQAEISDKSSLAYQRIAWEALKKSIHGYINKVNTDNITIIVKQLLKENIVRGRGLLVKSMMQAQAASPTFTPVYAALAAVMNAKTTDIGQLLVNRLIIQFKRAFKQNNKSLCISSGTFIAHLVNQKVVVETLIMDILVLLMHNVTNDSIEVAIALLKECGMTLAASRTSMNAIFEILRNILHEGKVDKRVQYMIEVMFQIRKDGFQGYPAIPEKLDLLDDDDAEEKESTYNIELLTRVDGEDMLNVFQFDPDYLENEKKYQNTVSSESESEDNDDNDSSLEEEEEEEDVGVEGDTKDNIIHDRTETNLAILRKQIYLTMKSSLSYEETVHKLMQIKLKPGQEVEMCHMIIDYCAEQRTYEKYCGLVAEHFCTINKTYVSIFQRFFKEYYETIHRLDTTRLRIVSKFFAHLLYRDAVPWTVLESIKMSEEDTTSSGRVFIKILFQELSEFMGLVKLNARLNEPKLSEAFRGLLPLDDPKKTRFAINFFTSIGLGGLTDGLRQHLNLQSKSVSKSST